VFLVSHDRAFVDNVVTSIIAHEPTPQQPARWREYEGSVQDWLDQSRRVRAHEAATAAAPEPAAPSKPSAPAAAAAPARRKLSYKEQRELETLPARIAALEAEQKQIDAELDGGALYATNGARATELARRHSTLDDELLQAMERWEVLDQAG
jgi:ATP-binding cassette subfamily F protein uup